MKATGRAARASLTLIAAALAAVSVARANVSVTVQPLVAEFNVAPGSTGHTMATVTNSGSSLERITVRRTDWRTLADGSIALEKVGAERGHSITRDLSLSSYQFTLQPGQSRQLSLSLAMPSSLPKRSASYWGGFIVNASAMDQPHGSVGVAATIFIYNNVDDPSRRLSLQAMRLVSDGKGNASLVARLRNTGQSYIRPNARVLVGQGGRIVRDERITVSSIFPSATRILNQDLGRLPKGEYLVELTIDYGGNAILDGTTHGRVR
jgi:hypothetical protein